MFPVNKDILMMISLACALIAIFYLYKDVQKTKQDVQKLSSPLIDQPKVGPKKPVAPPTPSPDTAVVADEVN